MVHKTPDERTHAAPTTVAPPHGMNYVVLAYFNVAGAIL